MKNLHIVRAEKFFPAFMDMIRENFERKDNTFFVYGNVDRYKIKIENDCLVSENAVYRYCLMLISMYKAEKIILHGLFERNVIIILFLNPWLLRKCYWVMWGADLYSEVLSPKAANDSLMGKLSRFVKGKVGRIITYLDGDKELYKSVFDREVICHHCIMYPSNTYTYNDSHIDSNTLEKNVNVIMGNSADPSNNHEYMIKKVVELKLNELDCNIFIPLSYGPKDYANRIAKLADVMIGKKSHAIADYMTLKEYNQFLTNIDIAIFAHERQQAMGNTINLLGLGKKVFMRDDVSQYLLFKNIGVEIFSLDEMNINSFCKLSAKKMHENRKIISKYFNTEELIKQWGAILS